MFIHALSPTEIAKQIAYLINNNNNLEQRRHTADILQSSNTYIVETHGNIVVGTVAVQKVTPVLSEIKHLVVRPDWRGKGIGKFLVRRALNSVSTPIVYATIRSGNSSSEKIFTELDFSRVEEYEKGNHRVAMYVRKICKEKRPKSPFTAATSPTSGR